MDTCETMSSLGNKQEARDVQTEQEKTQEARNRQRPVSEGLPGVGLDCAPYSFYRGEKESHLSLS